MGDSPYSCFSRGSPYFPFLAARIVMLVPMYVFLIVVCPLLCLTLLWRLDWFHFQPSSSPGATKRTTLHRQLQPRCPDDCSCTGYFGYPFEKCVTNDAIKPIFAPVIHRAESDAVAHFAFYCSVLERISEVASTARERKRSPRSF